MYKAHISYKKSNKDLENAIKNITSYIQKSGHSFLGKQFPSVDQNTKFSMAGFALCSDNEIQGMDAQYKVIGQKGAVYRPRTIQENLTEI